MAQVIEMDAVPRSNLPSSSEASELKGFKHALRELDALKVCDVRETRIAIENRVAAGFLSEAEADELFRWHGWKRSP
jgi:hypothetical protein